MAISASQVMELRAATGAGMMDCKKALEESGGDLEAARDFLRKKGVAVAAKKAARETTEGGVGIAISADGKQGGIVRLACETDFVARNEHFQTLLNRLSNQVLAKGGEGLAEQTLHDGGGSAGTVGALITESITTMGENLQLMEATRLEVQGEGRIAGYVHSNQKIGVLTVLGSDSAVDSGDLEGLARDIAMHIAASQVSAVDASGVDPALLAHEKEIFLAQAVESGKPQEIAEKMVRGRLSKFLKEVTLLDQPFVKQPDQSIAQLLEERGKALGAKLTVQGFVKYAF